MTEECTSVTKTTRDERVEERVCEIEWREVHLKLVYHNGKQVLLYIYVSNTWIFKYIFKLILEYYSFLKTSTLYIYPKMYIRYLNASSVFEVSNFIKFHRVGIFYQKKIARVSYTSHSSGGLGCDVCTRERESWGHLPSGVRWCPSQVNFWRFVWTFVWWTWGDSVGQTVIVRRVSVESILWFPKRNKENTWL